MPRKDGSKVLIWGNLTPMELRAHNSWVAMRGRTKRRDEAFADKKYYADKNVQVCERWENSFEAFLEDMGTPPTPLHSLDRKGGSKIYDKENCRWATDLEQAINRESTILVPLGDGRIETLSECARIAGISTSAMSRRYKRGWRGKDLISKPGDFTIKHPAEYEIDGVSRPWAEWAEIAGVTTMCLVYRVKIGLTGRDILNPPPPKLRPPCGGRPKGSKNKPKPSDQGIPEI